MKAILSILTVMLAWIAGAQPAPLPPDAFPTNVTVYFYATETDTNGLTSIPSQTISWSGDPNSWVQLAWDLGVTGSIKTVTIYADYTNAFTSPSVRHIGPVTTTFWPFVWSNYSITVSCNGTGNVYAAAYAGGPWFQIRTNFHGIVGTWTNYTPAPSQFYRSTAPMAINRYLFNP